MKFVDLHSHDRSRHPDVISIYNIRSYLPLNQDFDPGPASFGIHPWDAWNVSPENLSGILSGIDELYAVGECGLDKNVSTGLERQKELFINHIALSEELYKPLIIHCVGAFNEIINLKKSINPIQPWIIHGFCGHPQLACQLVQEGFFLTFGDSILKDGSKASNALAIIPWHSFFLETDQGNKSIKEIYARAAEIKKCSSGYLVSILFNQFKTIFNQGDGVD